MDTGPPVPSLAAVESTCTHGHAPMRRCGREAVITEENGMPRRRGSRIGDLVASASVRRLGPRLAQSPSRADAQPRAGRRHASSQPMRRCATDLTVPQQEGRSSTIWGPGWTVGSPTERPVGPGEHTSSSAPTASTVCRFVGVAVGLKQRLVSSAGRPASVQDYVFRCHRRGHGPSAS